MINRMNGEGDCSAGLKSVLAAGLVLCCLLTQGPLAGVRAQSLPPRPDPDAEPAQKQADEVSVARFGGTDAHVSMPLVAGGNMLLTDAVRINGKSLGYFMVDTGINGTLVDTVCAKELGLGKPCKDLWMYGKVSGDCYEVDSLALGPLEIRRLLVGATDLTFLQMFSKPVVGVIGFDVLSKVPFTVDYTQRVLVLHDPQHFKPPASSVSFDLLSDQSSDSGSRTGPRPFVEAVLNEQPLTFLLDTGLNRSVLVSSKVAADHPEWVGRAISKFKSFVAFYGEVAQYELKVKELKLFGQTWNHIRDGSTSGGSSTAPPAAAREEVNTIGGALLRHYRLTFDFAGRRLWVESAPSLEQTLQKEKPDLAARDFAGYTPLAKAAFYGEREDFLALLKAGAPVDFVEDKKGRTLLEMAVVGGQEEILAALLKHKNCPDVNQADLFGVTPLIMAAVLDEQGMASMLVKAGADLNQQDNEGRTALIVASSEGWEEMVRLLLSLGANKEIAMKDGKTPAVVAAARGDDRVFTLLLDAGAKTDYVVPDGKNLLHAGAQGGSVSIIQRLLRLKPQPDVNKRDIYGMTPLMTAAHNGHAEAVEALIAAGANILAMSAPGGDSIGGVTALHMAAMAGHADVVEVLLDQKMAVDAKTTNGVTPLMLATAKGDSPVVQLLLKHGADVSAVDRYKMTALHYAAKFHQSSLIPPLLQAGAKVDIAAENGVRPLDFAALLGDVDVARLLIEAGADPAAKGTHGNSAIDFARKQGHSSLVEFLEKKAASAPPAASGASPSPMVVEPPKEGGLSLNIRTPGGFKLIARGNILFCTDKDGKAVWQTAIPEGTTGFTIQNDKVMLKPHGPVIDLQSATLVPGPTPLPK